MGTKPRPHLWQVVMPSLRDGVSGTPSPPIRPSTTVASAARPGESTARASCSPPLPGPLSPASTTTFSLAFGSRMPPLAGRSRCEISDLHGAPTPAHCHPLNLRLSDPNPADLGAIAQRRRDRVWLPPGKVLESMEGSFEFKANGGTLGAPSSLVGSLRRSAAGNWVVPVVISPARDVARMRPGSHHRLRRAAAPSGFIRTRCAPAS